MLGLQRWRRNLGDDRRERGAGLTDDHRRDTGGQRRDHDVLDVAESSRRDWITEDGTAVPDPVAVVDCSLPHEAEVYDVVDLAYPLGAPYPGDEVTFDAADRQCLQAFPSFVGRSYESSRFCYF